MPLAYNSLLSLALQFHPPALALGDCDDVAVWATCLFPPPSFPLPCRATLAAAFKPYYSSIPFEAALRRYPWDPPFAEAISISKSPARHSPIGYGEPKCHHVAMKKRSLMHLASERQRFKTPDVRNCRLRLVFWRFAHALIGTREVSACIAPLHSWPSDADGCWEDAV